MFDLNGRNALVTGASGGIGGAIARALHGQGAQVVFDIIQFDPAARGSSKRNIPPMPKPSLRYPPGTRVFHAKHGEGIVLSSKKSNDDEEVEIQFGEAGRRVLPGTRRLVRGARDHGAAGPCLSVG